jgi:Spy/CpxP family protein refolding chaperone
MISKYQRLEIKISKETMRQQVFIFLFCVLGVLSSAAQPPQKFSPEKFQADMEQFITQEANLTPQESAAFFPLFREMQNKQRGLFNRLRHLSKIKPVDDRGCRKVIDQMDDLEIQLKQIEQNYHVRFYKILPPSKVFDVISAEHNFHFRALRGCRH